MSLYDHSKIKFRDPSEREVMRLFWRDDMENYTVNKWSHLDANMTHDYVNDEIPAFEGDYVLKINHPTDEFKEGRAFLECFKIDQKIGVEARFYAANLTEIWLTLVRSDPIRNSWLWGRVIWTTIRNDGNRGWQCLSDQVRDIDSGIERILGPAWCYVKMIVDFEHRRYDHLTTGLLDLDISQFQLRDASIPAYEIRGYTAIYLSGRSAANQPIYFDDVRLYLNEE